MDSFAPNDVRQYYRGAFIRNPNNPKQVVQVADVNEHGTVSLLDMSGAELAPVQRELIKWEHVRIPKLGFRSIDGALYYTSKIVANLRSKGVHEGNISVDPGTLLPTLVSAIDYSRYSKYVSGAIVRRGQLAQELFEPTCFLPINKAIEGIASGEILGAALDHDFAVTLGKYADRAYILHFKGWSTEIATSADGYRWTPLNTEVKNVINRSLGELKYNA